MKGITIKLSPQTLRRLREEAAATGRSVASLVRHRLEDRRDNESVVSVYGLTADLAGSVAGPRRSATNSRRRFRKP
jgi:hypothetical protein